MPGNQFLVPRNPSSSEISGSYLMFLQQPPLLDKKKIRVSLPKMSKMVQKVLKAVYDDPCLSLKEATEVSAKDASHVNSCSGGQKAANYGEMCPDSWCEVLKELKCDENDVFFDLGSGVYRTAV